MAKIKTTKLRVSAATVKRKAQPQGISIELELPKDRADFWVQEISNRIIALNHEIVAAENIQDQQQQQLEQ
jgi:hypothetical protein